jgi:cell division protein FtsB
LQLPTKPIIYAILGSMMILLGLIVFSDNGFVELRRLQREKERLEARNLLLTRQNYHLHRIIERLKNDPAYVEYVARRELGMVGTQQIIFKLSGSGGPGE